MFLIFYLRVIYIDDLFAFIASLCFLNKDANCDFFFQSSPLLLPMSPSGCWFSGPVAQPVLIVKNTKGHVRGRKEWGWCLAGWTSWSHGAWHLSKPGLPSCHTAGPCPSGAVLSYWHFASWHCELWTVRLVRALLKFSSLLLPTRQAWDPGLRGPGGRTEALASSQPFVKLLWFSIFQVGPVKRHGM